MTTGSGNEYVKNRALYPSIPDTGCGKGIGVDSINFFNINVCLESFWDFIYPPLLKPSPYSTFTKDNPFSVLWNPLIHGAKSLSAWNVPVLCPPVLLQQLTPSLEKTSLAGFLYLGFLPSPHYPPLSSGLFFPSRHGQTPRFLRRVIGIMVTCCLA